MKDSVYMTIQITIAFHLRYCGKMGFSAISKPDVVKDTTLLLNGLYLCNLQIQLTSEHGFIKLSDPTSCDSVIEWYT